jgi:spore maturation protein CgeB
MTISLDIVFLGLSLSSSWGNGHATTFRALLGGLAKDGHNILFLERDVSWYACKRDMPEPDFCTLAYYDDIQTMLDLYGSHISVADAVVIGSYVPFGVEIIDRIADLKPKRLCFYDIDTPVTLAKLNQGDEEYLAARQVSLFDTYFSFSGGGVLTTLEREYGAHRAIALYCSVDLDLYANTNEPFEWDLGYLGTYSPDRQPTLECLLIEPARRLPHLRFVVAGPQYPKDVDWPRNVARIEHLPPARHPSFYSRQRFTLNVTRADMIAAGWSPSVRLFEAAACGTPVISDYWRGLNELFPEGRAIYIARRTEDVAFLLSRVDETERRMLAAAALNIVAQDHTGSARARQFAAALINLPINVQPRQQPLRSIQA